MIRAFFSVVLLFLMVAQVKSQPISGLRDNIGVSAGAQLTDIVGSGAGFGNEPLWGFNVQGYYSSTIENRLFSRIGLMFTQKGTNTSIVPEDITIQQRLNYLQLPFSLNFDLVPGVALGAGIYGSLLLWSDFEEPPASASSRVDYREENVNSVDIGYFFDVSYLAPSGWSAFVRYERGFNTTDKANPFSFNQVISFNLGYLFGYSR